MGYGRSSTPLNSFWSYLKRGGIPATTALIAINILTFFTIWFGGETGAKILDHLLPSDANLLREPWTVVTYPLVAFGPIDVVFYGICLWTVGGSLERSWGVTRYLVVFSILTLVSAGTVLIGSKVVGYPFAIAGMLYPLSAMTMVFCLLNSEVSMRMYGLITIRAKYLAILIPVALYFFAGLGPIGNIFALGGCLAAYIYYQYGRSYSYLDFGYRGRPASGPDLRVFDTKGKRVRTKAHYLDGSHGAPAFFDIRGRIKARQDRKRLEKLFRQSGIDDKAPDFNNPDSDNKR